MRKEIKIEEGAVVGAGSIVTKDVSRFSIVAGNPAKYIKKRVLKTLRVDSEKKKFDLRSFDRHRRDSLSMDQLTWSPLIVDIYSYCTNSAIFDYGEGGEVTIVPETKHVAVAAGGHGKVQFSAPAWCE